MNINIDEYLNLEEQAFKDLEKYIPQIERIQQANEIGKEILSFIDSSLDNFKAEEFYKINIDKIVSDIKIQKKFESDILTEIYTEIENTFREGGKISLEEYLTQGNAIYNDIQNRLKGEVDYSIIYSEKELEKEENLSFNRFCTVLSMKNKQEMSQFFKNTKESYSLLSKEEKYLRTLDGIPFAESIEEKIEELKYIFLGMEQLSLIGCKIEDDINLNNFITNKIKDMTLNLSEYSLDENIKTLLNESQTVIESISNKNKDLKDICLHTLDKLEIVNEATYYNDLENENNIEL